MSITPDDFEPEVSIGEAIKEANGNTNYKYYHSIGNKKYLPVNKTKLAKSLPSGLYSIKYDSGAEAVIFQHEDFQTDELHNLPIKELDLIKNDISKFWEKEEKFNEYGLIHKRGILLYGKPGCGKSCAIQLVMNALIKDYSGIIFKISNLDDLDDFMTNFAPKFRVIEPDRKVLTILEDIDGLLEQNKSTQTKLLNLLDGINQSNNIVYLATTNYPERLEERILNRPSRFDKRYEFSLPSAKVREYYLMESLKEKDLKNIKIKEWVSESEGLSLAHLRELIVSVIILENDFETEIKILKSMGNNVSSTSNRNVGFQSNAKKINR